MPIESSALQQRLQRLLGYRALDPDNALLLRDCVDLHYQLGELAAARTLLAAEIGRFSEDEPLLFLAATLELAANQPARARDLLQQLLARGTGNGAIRYNLAYALGLLGEIGPALTALTTDWQRVCADAPRAPLLKAKLQHHDDIAGAIVTLRSFLETAPDDGEAHGDLALLLIDANDYEAAANHAERALAGGTEHYGALVARAMIELAQGEPERAQGILQRTVERREENGRSWLGLGLCELALGRAEPADPFLTKAVALLPNYLPAWHALAWSQLGRQQGSAAEATLRRALAIDERRADTHGLLAIAHILQGNTDAAQASIASAEALPGGADSTRHARGLLLLAAGDAAGAEALLQDSMKTSIGLGGG